MPVKADPGPVALAYSEIIQETQLFLLQEQSLDDAMENGLLDDMLYFQLPQENLHIPELSERPIDVGDMIRFIVANPERFALPRQLQSIETDALIEVLGRTYFERNVDELIERVRDDCVGLEDA